VPIIGKLFTQSSVIYVIDSLLIPESARREIFR
jgi:hypothetical protein